MDKWHPLTIRRPVRALLGSLSVHAPSDHIPHASVGVQASILHHGLSAIPISCRSFVGLVLKLVHRISRARGEAAGSSKAALRGFARRTEVLTQQKFFPEVRY